MRIIATPYRAALASATLSVLAIACSHLGGHRVDPGDARIGVMGRVDRSDAHRWRIGYPGVTLRLLVDGPSLRMRASCTHDCRVGVTVDGGARTDIRLPQGESWQPLLSALSGGPHTVELVALTEAWQGILGIREFEIPHGRLLPAPRWPERRLLFIGDSVTCGEAIDRGTDCAIKHDPAGGADGERAYGMLVARALSAQAQLVCYGGRGLTRDWRGRRDVPNAPQFFDLAVVDELPRLHPGARWDHARYRPDVVVISLGTNDFNLALPAFPDREEFVGAYVAFVRAIRARYPAAAIILTEGAIVSDEEDRQRPQKTTLRDELAETVRRLADPRVTVFASTHYPGDSCNAHPTRDQHAAMARDLEPAIRRAAGW